MIDRARPIETSTKRALRPIERAERQQSMRRHGNPGDPTAIGYDILQRSLDREDAVRAKRRAEPQRASTSDFVPRCDTCGQWPIRDDINICRGDGGIGHPYIPQAPVGLPVVR